jgi:DNA adenine methylase
MTDRADEARVPAPFLKWAGGKRQLVRRILALAPPRMETYVEPFLGGGAVFFALAAERRFARAFLGDANEELVLCYRAIQEDVDGVIRALRRHVYDRSHYYAVRDRDPAKLAPATRAARLIYLNRCGYNGLYRVNRAGKFNVPFGRYTNPVICDVAKLRAAHAALRGVELVVQDFEATLARATPSDFAYLDPPYVPLSETSSFTAYARTPFGPEEQARLAQVLRALGDRGVPALLSNSDCLPTRKLYRGLPSHRVPVRRAINSVASARGAVAELLVKSFTYEEASPVLSHGAWPTSTSSRSSTKRS